MELILPLPPSVNRIWRRVGNRTILSREARSYRKIVCAILEGKRIKTKPGPLAVDILFHPPDRRRRDIDNIQKALLDSLQHAGLYFDDSQIHRLCIERQELIPGGQVVVFVQPFVSTHSP
ncbi:MAG: RusA family crossover junction endodeoxyribonuclease [Pirellulaceae bacterium]|nr:RusA family crossover junction endodeoxyribonuclease [Pirellulaceae bacterium]